VATILLLLPCFAGIFFLALGGWSIYSWVTEKEDRHIYFESALMNPILGLVLFGIGLGGLFYLYSLPRSFVVLVSLALIAFPCSMLAIYGFAKWIDSTKYKELADQKGEAIGMMILGASVTAIVVVFVYAFK
jgi:hypothetical protein